LFTKAWKQGKDRKHDEAVYEAFVRHFPGKANHRSTTQRFGRAAKYNPKVTPKSVQFA
jgi:hypothetical protein